MRSQRALPEGWAIVGWSTVVLLAMTGLVLALAGTGESGIRMLVRATARTSFALFTAAFVASALHRLRRSPATAWLLANRRYVGVSFAVSHGLHLLALWALAGWSARQFVANASLTVVVLGGIAYVFLAAMTATSFDRAARWLGARRWQRLHTIGAYYIWAIFFLSYVPRAFASPLYVPFALVAIAAPVLRWWTRRRAPAMVAPARASVA